MYNNEVTYADKWDTPENKKAHQILTSKFLSKTNCSSDCPVSWSVEVLEFLTYIDRKYKVSKLRKHRPIFFKAMFNEPVGLWCQAKASLYRYGIHLKYLSEYYIYNRYASIYNWIKRPYIQISQIKEKFGRLIISFEYTKYFPYSAHFRLSTELESKIQDIEILLSEKGAYYPLRSLWDCYSKDWVPMEHKEIIPDENSVQIKHFNYRSKLMKKGHDFRDNSIRFVDSDLF